jgi:signal peptidase II
LTFTDKFNPVRLDLRLLQAPLHPRIEKLSSGVLVWTTVTERKGNGFDWKRQVLPLGTGVLALIAIDQVTKALVASRMGLSESIPVIPGLVQFTYVRNTGMAFGLLSGADVPFKTLLVTFASILALAAVAYYALRSPGSDPATRFGLILILGGALGNIIDRIRLGYVIDFIDVFYGRSHWPAFNVADSAISVGVGLLVLDSLRNRSPEGEPEGAAGADRRSS